MPNRRPHTKSRSGCVRCKQKHVKCDEVRPTCSFCARYNVLCVIQSTKSISAKASKSSSQSRVAVHLSLGAASELQSTSSPSSVSSRSDGKEAVEARASLSLWEFDLLHHWIINVTDSFDISPGFHRAWRDQAVIAATRYDFFMHMILILSALHLAITKSPKFTEKHREFILGGCSDAMSAFQREAQDVNNNNCEEILAFPFLVVIYGLALAQFDRTEKAGDTILDETVHILTLIKANTIVGQTTGPIVRSKLGKRWVEEEDVLACSDNSPGQSDLINAVNSLKGWINCSGDDEGVREINEHAAARIVEPVTFTLVQNLRPLVWPNHVKDEFLTLITARNPMALVILAHYAVILNQSNSQWWCANWGVCIVSAVTSCLPERLVPAMAFPLQVLGIPGKP